MTVAWEIKSLIRRKSKFFPKGYRNSLVTIWHVDPERGGSDDSCGFGYVRLTKWQIERLKNASWSEGRNPHFLRCQAKTWDGSVVEAEHLHRGLIVLVCRVLRIRLTWSEVCRYAAEATHIKDIGKAGDAFCFLPGYHSNSVRDSQLAREEHFRQLMCGVARTILTDKRPWWKHPRYHFWHFKVQVHFLTSFKRWAFSRCCKCGKRFSWGYAPVTNSWNSTGPRWFRGERDVFHSDCNRPWDSCVASAEPS
jgi:hypothetical protein